MKKLGGPQVVSSKLHLTWSTERERERQIHEETRETLNAAAASPLGPLPSTSYANPPSPIYAAQVQRVICNLLTRGKHFHVEHSESNNESSNYWRMWYTPISSSEYTPSEGLSKILLEAHKCAQVRVDLILEHSKFPPSFTHTPRIPFSRLTQLPVCIFDHSLYNTGPSEPLRPYRGCGPRHANANVVIRPLQAQRAHRHHPFKILHPTLPLNSPPQ